MPLLLVETDPAEAEAIATTLAQVKPEWRVLLATGVVDARQCLARQAFVMALVGHRLPDGTGLDLLPLLADTPALLIVAPGDENIAAEGMRQGFGDYLIQDPRRGYLRVLPAQIEARLEHARVLAQLRQSSARIELAFASDELGLWERDLATNAMEITPRWRELLGHATPGDLHLEDLLRLVHPDDRARQQGALQDYLTGRAPRYEYECRLRHGNGNWIWVLCRGQVVERDALGQPRRLLGTFMDMTARKKIEEDLEHQRAQFYALFNALPDLVWLKDRNGVYLACNHGFEKHYAVSAQDVLGKTDIEVFSDRLDPETARYFRRSDEITIDTGILQTFEEWQTPFGRSEAILLEISKVPVRDAHGYIIGAMGIGHDITGRHAGQQRLARQHKLLSAISQAQAVFLGEKPGEAFDLLLSELLSLTESRCGFVSEVLFDANRQPRFKVHAAAGMAPYQLERLFDATQPFGRPIIAARGTGERRDPLPGYPEIDTFLGMPIIMGEQLVAVVGLANRPAGYDTDDVGFLQPLLNTMGQLVLAWRTDAAIERLAFYDELTGLPNRRLLRDRLTHAVATSQRNKLLGALLFLDLDNFKDLNDTLGHAQGDHLLQQVAQRLLSCVRASDTVGRLGGDEFVIVLEGLEASRDDAAAQAETVGKKILASLNVPFLFDGARHHSTPSIGITLFGTPGVDDSVDELLKRADLSMYQAKAAGRNTLRFFDPGMQVSVTARAELEKDLRQGLQVGELLLHYQPEVDLNGRVVGVEALVRWPHPVRGQIPPSEFIPLAESTGLILPLGRLVLRVACEQLVAWSKQPATAKLSMAVNVSAREFRQPDFVSQVLNILENTGADPHYLTLELTESLLLHDVEDSIAKMTLLKSHGVSFSLDDFGTGYSSLAYLKRLPLDQLKIDQSFVRDVLTDTNNAAIARTIVMLAHNLGLEVVAEGVENEDQREFLIRHGCQRFQGYLFGRPRPAIDLRLD